MDIQELKSKLERVVELRKQHIAEVKELLKDFPITYQGDAYFHDVPIEIVEEVGTPFLLDSEVKTFYTADYYPPGYDFEIDPSAMLTFFSLPTYHSSELF